MSADRTSGQQHAVDLGRLAQRLDLLSRGDRDEIIRCLQERRTEQLEALAAPWPMEGPSAAMLHVRATRATEIRVIETALTDAGAPFEVEEPDA